MKLKERVYLLRYLYILKNVLITLSAHLLSVKVLRTCASECRTHQKRIFSAARIVYFHFVLTCSLLPYISIRTCFFSISIFVIIMTLRGHTHTELIALLRLLLMCALIAEKNHGVRKKAKRSDAKLKARNAGKKTKWAS